MSPPDHVEDRHDQEHEEPEPEGYVDLVIDHVDGENTETIKSSYIIYDNYAFRNTIYF